MIGALAHIIVQMKIICLLGGVNVVDRLDGQVLRTIVRSTMVLQICSLFLGVYRLKSLSGVNGMYSTAVVQTILIILFEISR